MDLLSRITKYLRDRYARSSVNHHFVILTNKYLRDIDALHPGPGLWCSPMLAIILSVILTEE